MGLDLGIVPTDEALISLIKRLNEAYPYKGSNCMLIAKQIREHDYLGAATTFALSFSQLGDDMDDLPRVLAALAEDQADRAAIISALYDILGDLTEEGDNFQLDETSCFGSYRAVHYFRSFAARTLDHWRKNGRLSEKDVLKLLQTSLQAILSYDSHVCPHLTEHSDCEGYYFPIRTKQPINAMFGSLYSLAEELIELHRTGVCHVLSSLMERRLGFDAYLLEYAEFVLTRYIMLVRFAVAALEFDDTIVFC